MTNTIYFRRGFIRAPILIGVIVVLLVGGIGAFYLARSPRQAEIPVPSGGRELTGGDCAALGGMVVNTLSGEKNYAVGDVLGRVTDMRCPCVCVKAETGRGTTPAQSAYESCVAKCRSQSGSPLDSDADPVGEGGSDSAGFNACVRACGTAP